MEGPQLISLVMAAYNAEKYIAEAIRSVQAQSYPHWELLVVNDGSTDGTAQEVSRFQDPRIHLFHKANGGIGSARNLALEHVKGSILGFIDADDILPEHSLAVRLALLNDDPEVDIADGLMVQMDETLTKELRTFRPTFRGAPFKELVRLTGSCFGGITWLLRWPVSPSVRFQEDSSQIEDLMFLIEYSQPSRRYDHVDHPVLLYRRSPQSSTGDLDGMDRSYQYVHRWLVRKGWADPKDLRRFRRRSRRVMVASWLHRRNLSRAFYSLVRPFT